MLEIASQSTINHHNTMSLKNRILQSTDRATADAILAEAQAHPHISGKNLRRCVTAHRSVVTRVPEIVAASKTIEVSPVSSTSETKPKRVRKPAAKRKPAVAK